MDRLEFRDVIQALLENALHEAQAGHCDVIDTEISHDAVQVGDDGRGLPVHPHPRSGRSMVEVIMTGPRRGPKNTLARVNAHCLWLDVEIHRDGKLWFQRYEYAVPTAPLQTRGSATRQGTVIRCAPAVGEPPTFDELRDLVRRLTREESGVKVKIRIRDLRAERDETIVIA